MLEVASFAHELDVPGGLFGRSVHLTGFFPTDAHDAPVVILHPGFQLDADLYDSYGEHLASRGFVAILVDAPDALVGGPTHADLTDYLVRVIDWVEEEADHGSLVGVADATRVGLAGHSMGGKIALNVAAQDPRPLGVFGIDPVDAPGRPFASPDDDYPSVAPERMGEITVPVVLLGETTNATCDGPLCQACAPANDNFEQYFASATTPALEIEVVGANHMSFLDDPECGFTCSACPSGSDNPIETRRLTRRALTAFFELVLMDKADARDWLTGSQMNDDVQAGRVRTAVGNGF